MNTFFTADTHFFHEVIRAAYRPQFADVAAMNEALVEAWNAVVGPRDRVWHLGDFALGSFAVDELQTLFNRLNGQKFLVKGNHDRNNKVIKYLPWADVFDVKLVRHGGTRIWLSHYPHATWPRSNWGSWHLHGHSHGTVAAAGRRLDVGVDAVGLSPIDVDEIARRMGLAQRNADENPPGTPEGPDMLAEEGGDE